MIRVGDKIETWFSGEADGLSTVLKVTPYTGKFKSWFSHVVRVTAPRTKQGWLEMSLGPDTRMRAVQPQSEKPETHARVTAG